MVAHELPTSYSSIGALLAEPEKNIAADHPFIREVIDSVRISELMQESSSKVIDFRLQISRPLPIKLREYINEERVLHPPSIGICSDLSGRKKRTRNRWLGWASACGMDA